MQGNIFDCPLLKCLFVSGVAIHVCVCLLCARVFVCVYNYTLVSITRVSVKTFWGKQSSWKKNLNQKKKLK